MPPPPCVRYLLFGNLPCPADKQRLLLDFEFRAAFVFWWPVVAPWCAPLHVELDKRACHWFYLFLPVIVTVARKAQDAPT